VKPVHVELPYKTRELVRVCCKRGGKVKLVTSYTYTRDEKIIRDECDRNVTDLECFMISSETRDMHSIHFRNEC